jgi:hypothetical protein
VVEKDRGGEMESQTKRTSSPLQKQLLIQGKTLSSAMQDQMWAWLVSSKSVPYRIQGRVIEEDEAVERSSRTVASMQGGIKLR